MSSANAELFDESDGSPFDTGSKKSSSLDSRVFISDRLISAFFFFNNRLMNRKFLTFFSNPAFDVEQYVERLAWRSRAASESSFDPQVLFDEFSAHIQGEDHFS